jgi:uncharacterized protein (DUF1684 family)
MKKSANNTFFLSIVLVVGLVMIYSFSGEQMSERYTGEVLKFRAEKNKMFKTSQESPLDRKQKKVFDSLNYFPVNVAYRVEADLEKISAQEVIQIKTTGFTDRRFRKYAYATFQLGNQQHKLLLLKSMDRTGEALRKNLLFLPFTDQTSGITTYGGGRYIDLELKGGEEKIWIDFNMAYNPYCAYNPGYDCPIPPQENHLNIEIIAGEKNFEEI